MKIIIVDDHEVVREGLAAALVAEDVELVGVAGTGAEALDMAERVDPDLAVVDLRLPDMSGVDLVGRLVALGVEVVVLSTHLDEVTVQSCLAAGARDYVTKSAGIAELRATIRRACAPGAVVETRAQDIVARMRGLVGSRTVGAQVSPQQERVLSLVASGFTNQQVANRLHLSESTVRFHLQKLKEVVGAQTRSQLVAKSIRLRLIDPYAHDPDVPE